MGSYRSAPVYRVRFVLLGIFALLLALALVVTSVQAAEFSRRFDFDGDVLSLRNLVGQVTVGQARGNEFQVEVTVSGDDADEDLIEFLTDDGDHSHLVIKFPLDEHDRYVYPRMGRNSSSTITFDDDAEEDSSWLRKVFKGISGERVKISGKGRGLEMWADVQILVPEGRRLHVNLGVGDIAAEDVAADLNLDTSSGPIKARNIDGKFLADTGSGSVDVSGITGNVNIDTGSGSVDARDCRGDKFLADTGSGGVDVSGIVCEQLHIDTGSGGVIARDIEADQAKIDTGSGSVEFELSRMGGGRFVVDTGSGGIDLILPNGASAEISADTGSGSVRNKISGADVRRQDRDELEMTIGGGDARVILDAGSGSITIRER